MAVRWTPRLFCEASTKSFDFADAQNKKKEIQARPYGLCDTISSIFILTVSLSLTQKLCSSLQEKSDKYACYQESGQIIQHLPKCRV